MTTEVESPSPVGRDPDAAAQSTTADDRPGVASEVSGLSIRLRALWRFVVVVVRFLPLVVAYLRDRRRFLVVGRAREVSEADQYRRAEFLLTTFVDLGPTFIKFGQMLSTRPDVLPGPYVEVLSGLQDEVPPDDWAEIEPVVESAVGPVDEAFDEFDRDPISGASLGQVYTARLAGERVAVKVLRPNIRQRVAADLRVLYTLVPLVVRLSPPGQAFTLENLAEEFAATIHEEMDYDHEAAMLERIRENFADDDEIRIPRAIEDYSTDRVLTMEYVGGVKITNVEELDARGIDREALVHRLQDAYIQMIVEDGVFQADPHPGNLAVQDDGTIVFYDFGMTGTLGPETRDQLFEFYVAVAEQDVDRIIDAFVALEALDPDANREMMRDVFELVIEQLRGQDIEEYQIQEFIGEFESELYDFPMRLPQNLALVVRVSTVLEGVCRTLDPDVDFIALITEYVRERQSDEGYEWIRGELTDRAREFGRSSLRVAPKVETITDRLEHASLTVDAVVLDDRRLLRTLGWRLFYGACFSGSLIATSWLYAFVGPTAAAAGAITFVPSAVQLYRSFRSGGFETPVQFTRHEMRSRKP